MSDEKLDPLVERISLMTDEELVKEYVDLCIWKNYFADDWGSGDYGHMHLLYDQLQTRTDISTDDIIDLYREKADDAKKKLDKDENVHYGRDRFIRDSW